MSISTSSRTDELLSLARKRLILNFADHGALASTPFPVIDRGEGCYVIDTDGKRYIDGISGLFCSNLGHSHGRELGAAAAAQMDRLPFSTLWSYAHPKAIELADKVATLAPDGIEHVFFTSGGSESVEAAWKLARQYHALNGEPQRRKAIARKVAYHGTSLGALSFTGIPPYRHPFEPLAVPTHHVSNTRRYGHPLAADETAFTASLVSELEEAIEFEGPDQVAIFIAEPVQNAGGALPPPAGYWQAVIEVCHRHGILVVSDEVICAYGRLGEWFGGDRYDYVPDLISTAKGLTSAHFSMGALLVHERVAQPFLQGRGMYAHGITFGGHPVGCAVALANLHILEREAVLENVRANETYFRESLERLRAIPLVGDVRGAGYFWSLELVADAQSGAALPADDCDWLLKELLSDALLDRGLICRTDDRGDPCVQLAPPLVADRGVLDEIVSILEASLTEADAAYRNRARQP
jgi:adenosylmethionine-8-amino-7-oxononanoate aminotransferase